MFSIDYEITIGGRKLAVLQSVQITKTVANMVQTAKIVLPAMVYNKSVKDQSKEGDSAEEKDLVETGAEVVIKLGYDGKFMVEFEGLVTGVSLDTESLVMDCEDKMSKERNKQKVENKNFDSENESVTVKKIAEHALPALGITTISCDYDFAFQKFVIKDTNAFEVFKRLKEESGAQIYMKNDCLHVHAPYDKSRGRAVYDFGKNIEKGEIKKRKTAEEEIKEGKEKYLITVNAYDVMQRPKPKPKSWAQTKRENEEMLPEEKEKVDAAEAAEAEKGLALVVTLGNKEGTKVNPITLKSPVPEEELPKRAETALQAQVYGLYTDSITGWLDPYVEPGYGAKITDNDYDFRDGTYFVNAVTTTVSSAGAVRKIDLGKKIE